jgi:addiction module RelE/StbE family toxin
MVTLHWTPQAIDDLKAIFQYISHDSRPTAKLFVEKIYYRVDQLRHFPLSGRVVPEIERDDIRELIYKNYRIVYQAMNKDHIRIITVFHSSKNLVNTKLT